VGVAVKVTAVPVIMLLPGLAAIVTEGVIFGLTVIVNVAVVAHCPAVGVKVYVVVAVLFNAGDQVPVIPLFDVIGNADKLAPEQIGATAVNVGVTSWVLVITLLPVPSVEIATKSPLP
jgi:hypothetical protein